VPDADTLAYFAVVSRAVMGGITSTVVEVIPAFFPVRRARSGRDGEAEWRARRRQQGCLQQRPTVNAKHLNPPEMPGDSP
jgi:hypothetical protein